MRLDLKLIRELICPPSELLQCNVLVSNTQTKPRRSGPDQRHLWLQNTSKMVKIRDFVSETVQNWLKSENLLLQSIQSVYPLKTFDFEGKADKLTDVLNLMYLTFGTVKVPLYAIFRCF